MVDNHKVYMKTTNGMEQVHVIYRRIDDEFLDPLVFNPNSILGVPGIIDAYRHGNVAIVNAVGNGVADDKAVYAYVPRMIEYYLNDKIGTFGVIAFRGEIEKHYFQHIKSRFCLIYQHMILLMKMLKSMYLRISKRWL